ncbi:MAG: type II toxin-antitoxin system VapC family toxin [bacterium]|nr:type II toxin-antitoxin system VapC family toxin [bacterium]
MILDTNILIAYLNGETPVIDAISKWRREGRALFISSVSFAEVLALPTLTSREVDTVERFLRAFISAPLDNDLAVVAALLKRTYRLKLPDAIIAATALTRKVPLITRDRQFRRIREIGTFEL